MDLAALRAEIARPIYAGMSDAGIAAALNAPAVPVARDVPTADVRGVMLATGEFAACEIAAEDAATPQLVRVAARTLVRTLALTDTIEASRAETWTAIVFMVGGLEAAGLVSAQTRAAVFALRDATISRAAELGLPPVTAGDVQTARIA